MKKKSKKLNPRKRPATRADVERAKAQTQDFAINYCWAIICTVLHDKYGYVGEKMHEMWRYVDKLGEELGEGRVSLPDLKKVLDAEEGMILFDKIDRCPTCRWYNVRHQKCSCCRENEKLKSNYEVKANG